MSNTNIKEEEIKCELLSNAIRDANASQIDTLWAVLKYKEIGILRKINCMCAALNISSEKVVLDLPKDSEGRILDYKTRHFVHDILIKYSKP